MEMPMNCSFRSTLPVAVLALLVSHCGGSTSTGSVFGIDAGADSGLGDAGQCEGTAQGAPPSVPPEHRASPAACPRTPATAPDGGSLPVSCSTDADCQGTSGATYLHCVEHGCGYDACLVDADCPSGQACVCDAAAGGGTRSPGNACVPAACHVDADCGGGAYCVPSRAVGCGGVDGLHCTSRADTCVDPTIDCKACGGTTCAYAPQVGHFVCDVNVCNG
jgi:hypothetical protein